MKKSLFIFIGVLLFTSASATTYFPAYQMTVQQLLTTIATVDAAYLATPNLDTTGNHTVYVCDCQSGAQAGCVAGVDGDATNGLGTEAKPYRTLDNAQLAGLFYTQSSGTKTGYQFLGTGTNATPITVAMCQGGSWNVAQNNVGGVYSYGIGLSAGVCTPGANGTPNYCAELRDYSTAWGGGIKPILNNYITSGNRMFIMSVQNGNPDSGLTRLMNLTLKSSWAQTSTNNSAIYTYSNDPAKGITDLGIFNVDFDHFMSDIAFSANANNNISIRGNHSTYAAAGHFIGSGNYVDIEYNSYINDGSDATLDHTLYFSSQTPSNNVTFNNNYLTGFSGYTGNDPSGACNGSMLTFHGEYNNLNVINNVITQQATVPAGCWGISAVAGGYGVGTYLNNATFTGNIVVNTGSLLIGVSGCVTCLVDNNVIIASENVGTGAIALPVFVARNMQTLNSLGTIRFSSNVNIVTTGVGDGNFASAAALQIAYPASSGNKYYLALVGSSSPYTGYYSNGTAWIELQQTATPPPTTNDAVFVGVSASTTTLQTSYPAASSNMNSSAIVGTANPYVRYYNSYNGTSGGWSIGSCSGALQNMYGSICVDSTDNAVTVTNNTIYSAATNISGLYGIYIGDEGAGHIIANNTIYYAGASGVFDCFKLNLSASSYSAYTAINNNNCASASSIVWEYYTGDSLSTWQSVASNKFDQNSNTTSPAWTFTTPFVIPTWSDSTTGWQIYQPQFKASSATGLSGVGNATYAPATDITGAARPNPPAIGAYQ